MGLIKVSPWYDKGAGADGVCLPEEAERQDDCPSHAGLDQLGRQNGRAAPMRKGREPGEGEEGQWRSKVSSSD